MSDNGASFSWGVNKDFYGTVIDADATGLSLPVSATDVDIALLAQRCKQLQKLDLGGCDKITDAGLQHLTALQQLQSLDLSRCDKITKAGLLHLTKLQQLDALNLIGCHKITDTGLLNLARLQQLQTLHTGGTSVTPAGLAAFKAAQAKAVPATSSGAAPAAASSPQADTNAHQQQQAATAAQQTASATASAAAELEELRAKAAKAAQLEAELAAARQQRKQKDEQATAALKQQKDDLAAALKQKEELARQHDAEKQRLLAEKRAAQQQLEAERQKHQQQLQAANQQSGAAAQAAADELAQLRCELAAEKQRADDAEKRGAGVHLALLQEQKRQIDLLRAIAHDPYGVGAVKLQSAIQFDANYAPPAVPCRCTPSCVCNATACCCDKRNGCSCGVVESIKRCGLPLQHLAMIAEQSRSIGANCLQQWPLAPPYRGVTNAHAVAIAAYTFDVRQCGVSCDPNGTDNLYHALNGALRNRAQNGGALATLRPYLWYLIEAWKQLPQLTAAQQAQWHYRGLPASAAPLVQLEYTKGRVIYWSSFTSTSVLESKAAEFVRSQGPGGVVFRIKTCSGRAIRDFSAIANEEEVLLRANCELLVEAASYDSGHGYVYVDLVEKKKPDFAF
jgi:chemotaxis protein histidine kinase CheA